MWHCCTDLYYSNLYMFMNKSLMGNATLFYNFRYEQIKPFLQNVLPIKNVTRFACFVMLKITPLNHFCQIMWYCKQEVDNKEPGKGDRIQVIMQKQWTSPQIEAEIHVSVAKSVTETDIWKCVMCLSINLYI